MHAICFIRLTVSWLSHSNSVTVVVHHYITCIRQVKHRCFAYHRNAVAQILTVLSVIVTKVR